MPGGPRRNCSARGDRFKQEFEAELTRLKREKGRDLCAGQERSAGDPERDAAGDGESTPAAPGGGRRGRTP